jgi:AcrR family transcriptional regulator
MGARADKRQAMTEAILTSAAATMDANGLDALTMDGLAASVGLSTGGLYRYFPGKGAIIVELAKDALTRYDQLQRELLAEAAPRVGTGPAGALAVVLVSFQTFGEHARRAPQRHRILDMFLSTPEQILDGAEAPAVEAALRPIVLRSAAALEQASLAGALTAGDGVLRTQILWAFMHGVDHLKKRDRLQPEEYRAQAILAEGIDALLRGWGANPKALATAHERLAGG